MGGCFVIVFVLMFVCSLLLDSLTLLKTKEEFDHSRVMAETKYKSFETKMSFEADW